MDFEIPPEAQRGKLSTVTPFPYVTFGLIENERKRRNGKSKGKVKKWKRK